MKSVLRIGGAFLVVFLLTCGAVPERTHAEEEGSFTAIPVIKGMKLLPRGTPAPTFVVKDLDGNKFDFSIRQKKQAHLLVFWSIFCESCREEMPVIEGIHNEFRDRKLEVLAINLDGTPFLEGLRGYIKQYGYTFRVLIDELAGEEFVITDSYQVAGTPSLYLVDDQGLIFTGHLGIISEEELKSLITDMLKKG